MFHFHHLSTEMQGKNKKKTTNCLKAYLKIQTKSNYRSQVYCKHHQIFSFSKKCGFHKMTEIEKEAVGFPVICHPVAQEFTKGGSTLSIYLY